MSEIYDSLRTWVEVDLDAIEYNLALVRNAMPQGKKLLAVVKANAYGHGAVRVSKFLEDKVDYLAVAATDEALEIRKSGVNCPILILGHIPYGDYDIIVKYDLIITISSLEQAKLLSDSAKRAGKTARYHIAVDTGMSRIGFLVGEESVKTVTEITSLPNLQLDGVFTHLAAADTVDKAYTQLQIERFNTFLESMNKAGIAIPLTHMYNSAAIADLDYAYDMVREGIILYGLNPSDEVEYKNINRPKPVMSMRSHVVQVKEVPAGVSVSYGCTYTTSAPTKIATVCAGYADGVPRSLSNNFSVIVNGKKAPIIGRVCMDQFMVDVTHIDNVKTGDIVTIFGADGEEYISPEDIANITGTIGYEIICNINSRVVRVYKKDGTVESAFCYLPDE